MMKTTEVLRKVNSWRRWTKSSNRLVSSTRLPPWSKTVSTSMTKRIKREDWIPNRFSKTNSSKSQKSNPSTVTSSSTWITNLKSRIIRTKTEVAIFQALKDGLNWKPLTKRIKSDSIPTVMDNFTHGFKTSPKLVFMTISTLAFKNSKPKLTSLNSMISSKLSNLPTTSSNPLLSMFNLRIIFASSPCSEYCSLLRSTILSSSRIPTLESSWRPPILRRFSLQSSKWFSPTVTCKVSICKCLLISLIP